MIPLKMMVFWRGEPFAALSTLVRRRVAKLGEDGDE